MEAEDGVLQLKDHRGMMPHAASAVGRAWERIEADGTWKTDTHMSVAAKSAPSGVPSLLRVRVPNGPERCGGEFELVRDLWANGMPVWKRCGGECHLYGDLHGEWVFGASAASVTSNSGALVLKDHRGILPHEASGTWDRRVENKWLPDPQVVVRQSSGPDAPDALHVSASCGPSWCIGDYMLELDKLANSMPVWRQRGGDKYLYGSKNGHWMICLT